MQGLKKILNDIFIKGCYNPFHKPTCNSEIKYIVTKSPFSVKFEKLYNQTSLINHMSNEARILSNDLEEFIKYFTEESSKVYIKEVARKCNETKIHESYGNFQLFCHRDQIKSISNHAESIIEDMTNIKEKLYTITALYDLLKNLGDSKHQMN